MACQQTSYSSTSNRTESTVEVDSKIEKPFSQFSVVATKSFNCCLICACERNDDQFFRVRKLTQIKMKTAEVTRDVVVVVRTNMNINHRSHKSAK